VHIGLSFRETWCS